MLQFTHLAICATIYYLLIYLDKKEKKVSSQKKKKNTSQLAAKRARDSRAFAPPSAA